MQCVFVGCNASHSYLLTNSRYLLLLASHTGAARRALGLALSQGRYTSCENGTVLIPKAVRPLPESVPASSNSWRS